MWMQSAQVDRSQRGLSPLFVSILRFSHGPHHGIVWKKAINSRVIESRRDNLEGRIVDFEWFLLFWESAKTRRLCFLYLGEKGKAPTDECTGGLGKSVAECADPCS